VSDSKVSGLKEWNAGIPVNHSSDKWGLTVFGKDSGIDLIVKAHQKMFPSYHCFWAQRIYCIKIAVSSYEHGTEKILSLSNIQQMSVVQQWEMLHTYTLSVVKSYKINVENHLHNCVCGARCLSRWQCYKYTYNVTVEKNGWIAIARSPLHRNAKVKNLKLI